MVQKHGAQIVRAKVSSKSGRVATVKKAASSVKSTAKVGKSASTSRGRTSK